MERPKHLSDGLKKGSVALAAGVGAGIAALFALPVRGAQQGGARGAAVGALKGVGGFIGFTLLGVGGSIVQVTRGAINTPGAIKAKVGGKEWDLRTHRWIFYDLVEEAELVFNMDEKAFIEYMNTEGTAARAPARSLSPRADVHRTKDVKETTLYDTLGVFPDATPSDIKKSYYRLAKQHHPDKNAGDEAAKKRFQEVSDAYQVLSDEEQRVKYDKEGSLGLGEQGRKMDAKAFYAMMFGSEEFEPLIGKIKVAAAMCMEDELLVPDDEDPETYQYNHMQLEQWKREVTCAMNLIDIIKPYSADGCPHEELEQRVRILAEDLSSTPVGGALLGFVGLCYREFGVMNLGTAAVSGGIQRRLKGAAMHGGHQLVVVKTWANAAGAGAKAVGAVSQLQDLNDEEAEAARQGDETEKARAAAAKSKAAAVMMKVMWHVTLIEVEDLLRKVCFKVTHDISIDKLERARRAEALIIVGGVFNSYAATQSAGLEDLETRVGTQMGATPAPEEEK